MSSITFTVVSLFLPHLFFLQNGPLRFVQAESYKKSVQQTNEEYVVEEFVASLTNTRFSNCFGSRISYSSVRGNSESTPWSIPTILTTEPEFVVNNTLSGFKQHQVKHNQQCIIYDVFFGESSNDHQLLLFFSLRQFQQQGLHSYIFVNGGKNPQGSANFLMSTGLKSYPHRALVTSHQNSKGISFSYFCYYCHEGNSAIVQTGKVYGTLGEVKSVSEIFPNVLNNLNGHTLRVTAPSAPPLALITPSKLNDSKYEIQGQERNILYDISRYFNWTCHLYPVPGGSTGSELPNGTWNGVMGEILYGRADIGLTVATSFERKDIADFTVPVFYAFLVLVSTKPVPVFEWQSIFYPFKIQVWSAIVISTVGTLYLFKCLHNRSVLHRQSLPKGIRAYVGRKLLSAFEAFYMTVGSILEQSSPKDFDTVPSRLVAAFWMMFSIIITCAYRSKLFSFLISPTILTPPSTLEELPSSEYSWGMKSLGGVALQFITKSPLQFVRNIGERMEIYTDKYSCLDKTFLKRFTCIIYKAYIDYMMDVRYWKVKHLFHVSDFVTPPVGSSWALEKYSPMRPNFDEMTYRIHEMGLADKHLYDYQVAFAKTTRAIAQASNSTEDTFAFNTNFENHDDSSPSPLELPNLYGAFFILGIGIAFSVVAFLAETIAFKKNTRRPTMNWEQVVKYVWNVVKLSSQQNSATAVKVKSTTFTSDSDPVNRRSLPTQNKNKRRPSWKIPKLQIRVYHV